MTNTYLLKLLLVLSLILLLEPTSNAQDSLKCYNRGELQKIATKMIRATECDSLLINTEIQNQSLLLKLDNKDSEIFNLNKVITLKDTIIIGKTKDFDIQVSKNKDLTLKNKILKLGWLSTGVIMLVLLAL